MSSKIRDAEEEAKAIIAGYCSVPRREPITDFSDPAAWQDSARAVLRARQMDAVLQAFSDDTLQEIANGQLDMAKIYKEAKAAAAPDVKPSRSRSPGP